MDEIINALRNLKMPGMAHYWATMQETRQAESLSLKDGLQLLIQAELDNRNQSRNARLIKKAHFPGYPYLLRVLPVPVKAGWVQRLVIRPA